MNKIQLSNTLFHSFDGSESQFLKTLEAFRSQPLSVKSMQSLRRFTKKVDEAYQDFVAGKNDIVNQYGTEKFTEDGVTSLGKELKWDNLEGMKAYNELLNLQTAIEVEIINLEEEELKTGKSIIMSSNEYDSLSFLFEEMVVPEAPVENEEAEAPSETPEEIK